MTYTQQQLDAAAAFINNNNVTLSIDKDYDTWQDGTSTTKHTIRIGVDLAHERIWTGGNSIWSETGAVKGVKCSEMSLNAYKDEHYDVNGVLEQDDDNYWSGGLTGYVHYDGSGKDGTWNDGEEYTLEEKGGLINGMKKEGTGDGFIYTDEGFINNLVAYTVKHCDFNEQLLGEFLSYDYSEQGAQEEGCVNMDVDLDGDFWLAAAAHAGVEVTENYEAVAKWNAMTTEQRVQDTFDKGGSILLANGKEVHNMEDYVAAVTADDYVKLTQQHNA